MTKKSKLLDQVCKFGEKCYCNPSFDEELSKIFIVSSIILLIITIIIYLVYLNRHSLARLLVPNSMNNTNNTNNTK